MGRIRVLDMTVTELTRASYTMMTFSTGPTRENSSSKSLSTVRTERPNTPTMLEGSGSSGACRGRGTGGDARGLLEDVSDDAFVSENRDALFVTVAFFGRQRTIPGHGTTLKATLWTTLYLCGISLQYDQVSASEKCVYTYVRTMMIGFVMESWWRAAL